MASLANWYSNQYGVWRRTRRLSMPQFVADGTTIANARAATGAAATTAPGGEKNEGTLFGPSLGAVGQAPEWTNRHSAAAPKTKDELTADVVRTWVARSKDPSTPTTTLQALVNLKRPSLRLSPLSDTESGAHAIEFEYDVDAPKCSIAIHVLPPSIRGTPVTVYDHILDGGFARQLKLDDDASIELTKYESTPANVAAAGDTPGALPASASQQSVAAPSAQSPASPVTAHQNKRRFSAFHFRKPRVTPTAGPALQVVDVDAQHNSPENSYEHSDTEGGVRVIIKLEALDENEHTLSSVNTQTTYLHIVRLGPKPESAGENEQDTRPWVVRVVKREATIGYHTFHLHEIYGLTSTTSTQAQTEPAAPTYPPTVTSPVDASYEFAGQECVLCLSSPREVVLLPCRHLVACRECALNMIEFGAGGQLNQSTEPAPTAGGDAPDAGDAGVGDATTPAPAPVPAPAPRTRKRKPKGWFCPVCRQPYTSLLRISTTPPDAKQLRDSEDGEEEDIGTVALPLAIPVPVPVAAAPTHVVGEATPSPVATPTPAAEASTSKTDLPDDAVVIPVLHFEEPKDDVVAAESKQEDAPSSTVKKDDDGDVQKDLTHVV